jgi:membrane protein CcdC involved in cytochrome C biogenesis
VLTSFILLLALIALAGLFYTIRQKTLKGPVVIAGNELPPSLLYSLAIIVCVPLFYLSGATGIIGWIIGMFY